MAGRAGRRGLDDRGIVIQMIDEKMDQAVARHMLTVSALIALRHDGGTCEPNPNLYVGRVPCCVQGGADNLNSAFHLSYNMILNLMRVEDIKCVPLRAVS